MDQDKETPADAIRRLQQKIDRIDETIQSKRRRVKNHGFSGPFERLIEREIQELIDQRNAILRNIFQLKKITVES